MTFNRQRKILVFLGFILLTVVLISCGGEASHGGVAALEEGKTELPKASTPVPTRTEPPTPTPVVVPTPDKVISQGQVSKERERVLPTDTPLPTYIPVPTSEPVRVVTVTPSPVNTVVATHTSTSVPSPEPTEVVTATPSPVSTVAPTKTPSPPGTGKTVASKKIEVRPNPSPWPPIVEAHWLDIQGLTELVYPNSQDPVITLLKLISSDQSDDKKEEQKTKVAPGDPVPDWMLGYPFAIKVPIDYSKNSRDYPVVVYLHGGQSTPPEQNNSFMDQFYMSLQDPYILVGPTKVGWEWDAEKISDVIQDVRANLRVDDDRIYLTGVSMGGRGSYIVAAALPELFAALMPLSSHHGPYSYVKLAPMVKHLPIWTSHGDQDAISSYDVATEMVAALEKLGVDVTFWPVPGGDHGGWSTIYRDQGTLDWLLSHKKKP